MNQCSEIIVSKPKCEYFPPGEGQIHVSAAPSPFSTAQVVGSYDAGLSISELLEEIQPDSLLRRYAHVFIEGYYIPKSNWSTVRPKPDTHVTIRTVPAGGGKSPLRIILIIVTIILAAVALYFGQPQLAALILSVGFSITQAVAPPPKPKTGGLSGTDVRDSPTLFITGARNQFNPFGVIPRVLGKHLMLPLYAAVPFTEVSGENQFLRMIFTFGYGPLVLEDLRIGETALTEYEDVETEFRRGFQAVQLTSKGSHSASGGGFPGSPVFGDLTLSLSIHTPVQCPATNVAISSFILLLFRSWL